MSFTVYKSSAGSGKTFTLVKEYLKLALSDSQVPPQHYRRILAITFTNKAATEMKERILKALKDFSDKEKTLSGGSLTLLQVLQTETGIPEETLRSRAQNVLSAILHNYADFAVGTIDKFVHKIIRTFAFDLKLPANFDIETNETKLLSQAVDLLIARVGNDKKLTQVLVEFTQSKADDEKSWHIESDLQKFAKNLLKDEGILHIEKLKKLSIDDFLGLRNTLYKKTQQFEQEITTTAEQACQLIKQEGLEINAFYQGRNGIGKYFENLSKGRIDKIIPNSYVIKTIDEGIWYGKNVPESDKISIDAIQTALYDAFKAIETIRTADYSNYVLFSLIRQNIYSMAVLNELEKVLAQFKKENNILHIAEFNKIISGIVLYQPVPFIYERLGERYHNYLIDEFQDTSVLQFQNLLPLIENSLASANFNMIVGDGKQAIYRWRGGEVEQFAKLPEIHQHDDNPFVMQRAASLKSHYVQKHLNKNYRSKAEVIDFNNKLFRVLSSTLHPSYQPIYEGLEQEFDPKNTGGYVSIDFIDTEKDIFDETMLEKTFETIQQLSAAAYQKKDIAVLVRSNRHGNSIADFLTERNIPVISSDSLLLKKAAGVNFIISFLNYMLDASDDIARAAMLSFLQNAEKIPTTPPLHELMAQGIVPQKPGLFNGLLQKLGFDFDREQLSELPLYELCEEAIRIFGLNEPIDPYIEFFLDEIHDYSIKNQAAVNDFLTRWDEDSYQPSISVSDGMDAVSIMTIHRAKGLEFSAVILPYANWTPHTRDQELWVDIKNADISLQTAIVPASSKLKDTSYADVYETEQAKTLLDQLNLLYVALTRAGNQLYILCGQPPKSREPNMNNPTNMLHFFLQQNGDWSDEERHYEYGTFTTLQDKKQDTLSKITTLKSLPTSGWKNKLQLKSGAEEMWETDDNSSRKDYGVMVHNALSRIKTKEDTDGALTSMLLEGLIDAEEKRSLEETLHTLLQHTGISKFFEPGLHIRNESEILLPGGTTYRPDRVILNGKEVTIIDYKTGKVLKKHQKQLEQYAELLEQMNYIVKGKYLIYLEEMQVEHV